jgi:hypothetical protein
MSMKYGQKKSLASNRPVCRPTTRVQLAISKIATTANPAQNPSDRNAFSGEPTIFILAILVKTFRQATNAGEPK